MHYRKLVVWEKAMELARRVYGVAPLLPREEVYGLRSQMTRAAVSVPSNIAEGWTRETVRERRHFLSVAQGSLAELETQLTLCEQLGWFPTSETIEVRGVMDEVSRMLTALRRKARSE